MQPQQHIEPRHEMPQVKRPAVVDSPFRIGVVGLLSHDTIVVTNPAGRVHLMVRIDRRQHDHPDAPPILVRLPVPDYGFPNAAHAAAHDKASRLRAGMSVVALAKGIELSHHMGEPVLLLTHPIDVIRSEKESS